jgi:hypothetical protein
VAGRADIECDIVAGDDVRGVADIILRLQQQSSVVEFVRLIMFDEGDIVRLVRAGSAKSRGCPFFKR